MRALQLTTRFRKDAFEAEACLLIYDDDSLTGSEIGADVRDVLNHRPNTSLICVMAPFIREPLLNEHLATGSSVHRASATMPGVAGEIAFVALRHLPETGLAAFICPLFLSGKVVVAAAERALPEELRQGWLFDLFDRFGGRVDAPVGVHFGKASGKHADKFLRTSSVLLSTSACTVVGFFALCVLKGGKPRRIFVDTAPLLTVVYVMQRIAAFNALWQMMPTGKSFSSYGGIEKLPLLGTGDLILVSASTSGELASRLIGLNVHEDALLTLFLLSSSPAMQTKGKLLCDLTYRPGRTFGYPLVENQPAASCTLCQKGFILAELSGDQFLLENRGIKRLRVSHGSQPKDARDDIESLSRAKLLKVALRSASSHQTDIEVDVRGLLIASASVRQKYVRLLTRFTPAPVTYVVLVGIDEDLFDELAIEARLFNVLAEAKVVKADVLGNLPPVEGGNVLVAIGHLFDHAALRGINAQLRAKVPMGCVSYLSVVTVADSARNLSDLRTFLSWGEYGADTFIYRGAVEFMLPWAGKGLAAWTQELEFLQALRSDSELPDELADRLNWLESSSSIVDQLFLPGKDGELQIANDFVYLNTKIDKDQISQADIYAVVANLLACTRCENEGLKPSTSRGSVPLRWTQSVYGQVLLCPSNFKDYNDAVLRGAFLRAASSEELCYSVDEGCSSEMLDILLAEIQGWSHGKGNALPEFLISLSCRRLKLKDTHLEQFQSAMKASSVPQYLVKLAAEIEHR